MKKLIIVLITLLMLVSCQQEQAATATPAPNRAMSLAQVANISGLTLTLHGDQVVSVVCDSGIPHLDSGTLHCMTAPLPTDTPAPLPTASNTPMSTSTPQPTVTATATPNAPIAPFVGAPLCDTHDDRVWHGLWDAQRGCHYDHTHRNDPRELDDIFGTQFYEWAGGEISYPWQTFSGASDGYEHPHPESVTENGHNTTATHG